MKLSSLDSGYYPKGAKAQLLLLCQHKVVHDLMDHPVLLLSRKKAEARWGTLARCFAARRLPKTELSTVVLPHVTQSFSRGVPRELAEISQFEDKGRNSIDLKNIIKMITKIITKILTNFPSNSDNKKSEN